MRQSTIGPALSRLEERLSGRDIHVPSRSSRAHARRLRLPVVPCFLRHIGAAGFRVKRAVGQEAVRLGRFVFQRMQGTLELGVAAMGRD